MAVLTASTSGYVVMSLSLKSLTLAIYSFGATLAIIIFAQRRSSLCSVDLFFATVFSFTCDNCWHFGAIQFYT